MALKPDRQILEDDISYFYATSLLNTSTDDRGGIVCATGNTATAPSGAAMDQSSNQCSYIADPSGAFPVGLLLNDVVNIDLTRQILNPFKAEAQVGDKVVLMRKGYVVTNKLDPAATGGDSVIKNGNIAYVGPSGAFTADPGSIYATGWHADGSEHVKTSHLPVGRFLSRVDEDGYAKVYVDLSAAFNFQIGS